MGTSITNNAEIEENGGDDADSTPGSEANGMHQMAMIMM